MRDPRIDRLAELIVDYSLGLQEGKILRIDALSVAAPLALELYRAALAVGAHPYANISVPDLVETMLAAGSEEQLTHISPIAWEEVERLDALVTVWSEVNTRALSGVDPARQTAYIASQRKLANRRWERIFRGETTWCGTLFPTNAHAQEAEMSLEDYEDFVFTACHVHEQEPAAHWSAVSTELAARAAELGTVRDLRIVGPDTDLRVGVAGRTWLAADGRYNMPDGEVFTSPVETETEGVIRFTFPALYHGREVQDIHLRFEEGRVLKGEASRGDDYLASLLDMDAGARIVGEVAFGLNYEIDRFTRNILFDEKIGGTIHLALGSGFQQAGGRNTSGLHWDMICDLRDEGEVYADGEVIWRNGRFTADPAVEIVETGVGG
jgi:aminopeptidase